MTVFATHGILLPAERGEREGGVLKPSLAVPLGKVIKQVALYHWKNTRVCGIAIITPENLTIYCSFIVYTHHRKCLKDCDGID